MTNEDLKKLKNCVKELSNSMTRVDAERDYQKDAINKISDEIGVGKKQVRALARIYHKQNFVDFSEEQEEVISLYESITS